jgi:hypothetical protein
VVSVKNGSLTLESEGRDAVAVRSVIPTALSQGVEIIFVVSAPTPWRNAHTRNIRLPRGLCGKLNDLHAPMEQVLDGFGITGFRRWSSAAPAVAWPTSDPQLIAGGSFARLQWRADHERGGI